MKVNIIILNNSSEINNLAEHEINIKVNIWFKYWNHEMWE